MSKIEDIDELIESEGGKFKHLNDDFIIVLFSGSYVYSQCDYTYENRICTVAEYKERLYKQQLIKLIESACTDDAASIANVIIRNGWVKK